MEVKELRCRACGRMIARLLCGDFVMQSYCAGCHEQTVIECRGETLVISPDGFHGICNKARLEFKRFENTEEHIKNVPRCIILDGD